MTPDTPHPVLPWLTAPRRRWLYRLALAVQPLAVALGATTSATAGLAVAVIAAVLSAGVALPNVAPDATGAGPYEIDRIPPHGKNPELIDAGDIR